jgi:hypothetical protein
MGFVQTHSGSGYLLKAAIIAADVFELKWSILLVAKSHFHYFDSSSWF